MEPTKPKPRKLRVVKEADGDPPSSEMLEGNSDIYLSVSLLGLCFKRLTQDDLKKISQDIRAILPPYVKSVSFRVEKLSTSDLHQTINPRVKS
jgi:hypothetical protein